MEIFIKNGEKKGGPYSKEELQGLVNEGKLSRTTLAIHDGLSNWIPLAAVLTTRTVPPPHRPEPEVSPAGGTGSIPLVPLVKSSSPQVKTPEIQPTPISVSGQDTLRVSPPPVPEQASMGSRNNPCPPSKESRESQAQVTTPMEYDQSVQILTNELQQGIEQIRAVGWDGIREGANGTSYNVGWVKLLVVLEVIGVLSELTVVLVRALGSLGDLVIKFAKELRFRKTLSMEFMKVPNTEVMFSIWDTRVGDYRVYAEANIGVDESWRKPGFLQAEDHPVVNVSWFDAQAFCAWLTQKERVEGKIGPGQRYRLPTDAEWSVAVGLEGERGGSPKDKNVKIEGVYPWGTQWPPPKGGGNYDPSLGVDDYNYTSPVGRFASNKHGLYDMGGNVWQWCEDWYDGDQTSRVLRGASWRSYAPDFLFSSGRNYNNPDLRSNRIGFRCVLVGGGSL